MVVKIGILLTDHPAEWTGSEGTFDKMIIRMLERTRGADVEVEYRVFDVYHGEVPSIDEIRMYDGVVITGSRYDSYSVEHDWINKLRELVKEMIVGADEGTMGVQRCKIVGICFGHQIVGNSIGCVVGKNENGIEAGIQEIQLNEIGEKLFSSDKLYLSELHNDTVINNSKVLVEDNGILNWGSTDTSEVQGFYKKGRLFTVQGHPEFISETAINGLLFKKTLFEMRLKEGN
ncbi:hypothetical protein Kpol_543p62 [Vanderwaltozyma polyspora DSM 70294]|uniref:Glutamine amidotransferase domain-containing protein n=1 Tax=Vanderwaltozyma polyspora (strain ATCC 22028 / DSM 70294 / BCRC 21397 / CBS 2163 / NBRC 10782 / NRRL Y-8283 / UCD 57-17) TaxID=436907 RepID=A7THR6_VANPO|nr:uncharacterized protein Kpol_543p62 [Vanderwaltozyma polyspora DSM 70294]EDO18232.1 hypothetical protein Kpol_543p62 [Vanderwaltozyma polyspora DSM 70294]